jgi:hypothetical protein
MSTELPSNLKVVYEESLCLRDTVKLRQLADAFETDGWLAQASMLRKRAAVWEAPEAVKDERRATFRRAMASTDVEAIKKIAADFDEIGLIEAPKRLRERIEELETEDPGMVR